MDLGSGCRIRWPFPKSLKAEVLFVGIAVAILVLPTFVSNYRASCANLISTDPYREMLIGISNKDTSDFMAPFAYRPLGLLLAIPVYCTNSAPMFTKLQDSIPRDYQNATWSLISVSFLFLVASSMLIYFILRSRDHSPLTSSIVLAVFWCSPSTNLYLMPLVDAISIFLVCASVWLIRRNSLVGFSIVALLGLAAKETVILVLLIYLIVIGFANKKLRLQYGRFCVILLVYMAIYIVIRAKFPFPASPSSDLSVAGAIHNISTCWRYFLGVHGFLWNILPLWPVVLPGVLYLFFPATRNLRAISVLVLTIVPFSLVVISCIMGVKYNVGRVVFLSFPIFIVPYGELVDYLTCTRRSTS